MSSTAPSSASDDPPLSTASRSEDVPLLAASPSDDVPLLAASPSDDVLGVVRAVIVRVLEVPPESVTRATALVADLAADSLALVEIVELLEEQLAPLARANLRIEDEDIDALRTVGDLVDLASSRM